MGFWSSVSDWYSKNKGWVDPAVTAGVGYYTSKKGEDAMEQSAEASNRAAELAYQRSLPWNTGGLFGAAAFDPKTRRAIQTLSPELKAQYDQYLKQSKTHGAYIPQAQAEFARQRALAKSREGAFTKQLGYIPEARRRYEEQMAKAAGTEADYKTQMSKVAGAESDFAKQRGYAAKMEGDPIAAGKKFYDMQKAVYAPEQERQRLSLESRLLSQGMLGSSGGKARQQALLGAQGQQDLQAQAAATQQAQQMIDKYRGRSAEEQRLADIYRRRGSEEQQRGDLYTKRGLQQQDLMDKYRSRANQEQAWAGMFRDRSKQEQALIDTYRSRRAGDLAMVESLGKLPQSYSSAGQGIGQGMSSIAQSAAGMQQAAAQGMADASAAKWGGVASNVGNFLSPKKEFDYDKFASAFKGLK